MLINKNFILSSLNKQELLFVYSIMIFFCINAVIYVCNFYSYCIFWLTGRVIKKKKNQKKIK